MLALTCVLALIVSLLPISASAVAGPNVEVEGPLIAKRSEIANKDFIPSLKWNANEAWASYKGYQDWVDNGIIAMLSKININGMNIQPQEGDDFSYSRIHEAMGGGSTSMINQLSRVMVLVQKVRKVPQNLPLNAFNQLKEENQYTPNYEFKTTYSLDYGIYSPLFINDFIVIDDYRQVSFIFDESDDGVVHGRFTGDEEFITLDTYLDTLVPNNVIGVIEGESLGDAGFDLPEYQLDEGWRIREIRDSDGTPTSVEDILNRKVFNNEEYTIFLEEDLPEIIEVTVPAIWYPIDKETGEIIEGLTPIPTYPDMYPRPEAAKLDEEGVYMIDYMGVPYPEPNTWSANNFMYTGNLWFSNRFHRVVGQGYSTYDLGGVSTVYRLEYGDFWDEDTSGLHGASKTAYQEGETMKLYIATREDTNLSNPVFNQAEVKVMAGKSNSEIRQQLLNNIEKVEYLDLEATEETLSTSNPREVWSEISVEGIDRIFIYQYDAEDEGQGSFIKNTDGTNKNFNEEGLSSLAAGKYEVVFPIYWRENIPEFLSAPDIFSRNRYKFDDTFHFTMVVENPKPTDGGSGGGGGGGTVVIPEPDVPLGLNADDHFAYIQGYPDNTVKPQNNITREEVAAVFFRLLDPEFRETIRTMKTDFLDISEGDWSLKHIATLANGKIIEGYPDGNFRSGSFITRAELAAIAARFDKLEQPGEKTFTDTKGHWAEKYILSSAQKGWVQGYEDGSFKPDQYITRAEFVTLVNNVLGRKVQKEHILPEARQFPDLEKSKWYYEAMQEAINSHDYERIENGFEKWTQITQPIIEM